MLRASSKGILKGKYHSCSFFKSVKHIASFMCISTISTDERTHTFEFVERIEPNTVFEKNISTYNISLLKSFIISYFCFSFVRQCFLFFHNDKNKNNVVFSNKRTKASKIIASNQTFGWQIKNKYKFHLICSFRSITF